MSEQQKTRIYINAFTLLCGRPPRNIIEVGRFVALLARFDYDLKRLNLTSKRVAA